MMRILSIILALWAISWGPGPATGGERNPTVMQSCESRCNHKCKTAEKAQCVANCLSGYGPQCTPVPGVKGFHWPTCNDKFPDCVPPFANAHTGAPEFNIAVTNPEGGVFYLTLQGEAKPDTIVRVRLERDAATAAIKALRSEIAGQWVLVPIPAGARASCDCPVCCKYWYNPTVYLHCVTVHCGGPQPKE